ncbi:MAG: hypothetical protein AAB360_02375 [Patescibacteria group bacterium]
MELSLDEVSLRKLRDLRYGDETLAEVARRLLVEAIESRRPAVSTIKKKRTPRRGLRGWIRRLLWRGGTTYVPNPV